MSGELKVGTEDISDDKDMHFFIDCTGVHSAVIVAPGIHYSGLQMIERPANTKNWGQYS